MKGVTMSIRYRLILDAVLSLAVVAAYYPTVTGLTVHEWLAIALVVPLFVHLLVNWEWVVRTSRSVIEKLRAASPADAIVDVALFASTVTVMLSGLLISRVIATAFGIAGGQTELIWHTVHSISATSTVLIGLLHTALHGPFILRGVRNWYDGLSGAGRAAGTPGWRAANIAAARTTQRPTEEAAR
jgi:hypothetical protein